MTAEIFKGDGIFPQEHPQRTHKYFTVDFFNYKEKDKLLQASEMKGVTAVKDATIGVISDPAFGKHHHKHR